MPFTANFFRKPPFFSWHNFFEENEKSTNENSVRNEKLLTHFGLVFKETKNVWK